MAANFDFNAAPAQDGVDDMLSGESDDDVRGSNDEDASVSSLESDIDDLDFDSDNSDNAESSNRQHLETHDRYDNRWLETAEERHERRHNGGRDYSRSVLSDDTEDSWDERVISNYQTGENDIMLTHKKIVSIHRQKCYRREHSAYVAELKAAGKVLAFPNFCQLPPELRLRIWEMHCPSMLRSQRVLQLALFEDGSMKPGKTMEQQTKSTREFMSICQETRALGERYLPDTLKLWEINHDDLFLRYNAEKDIIYLTQEVKRNLDDVKSFLGSHKSSDGSDGNTSSKYGKDKQTRKITRAHLPYTSVRNIAICDYETRTREAGIYHDRNYYGSHGPPERIRPDEVSHRVAEELRGSGWSDEWDFLFPNIENFYVLENGGPHKTDRWIGHDRSYERHHIRTIEIKEHSGTKKPCEHLYCWHGPPKGFRGRRALPVDSEAAPGGHVTKEVDGASPVKDEAEADDGDFKDECIINHFSRLRNKGVRFSRMLYFDGEEGMEDYYRLRSLTCPDGTWPNDSKGQPRKDENLRVYMWDGRDDTESDAWTDDSEH